MKLYRTKLDSLAAPMSDQFAQKISAPYRGNKTAVVVLERASGTQRALAFGDVGRQHSCAPEDVLFEIGSITKVFTSLLLARLAEDGQLDPDSPISLLCEAFEGAPEWITPRRLATHSSGLPRLHIPVWKALISATPAQPYGRFSREDLIAWMREWRPAHPPKAQAHRYSNLGFGLLAEVLALSQGSDYETLLHGEVLGPLGLNDTATTLSPAQLKRFAQPHSSLGRPVEPWVFKAMAGAGALRSTAADLGRFSSRVLEAIDTPQTAIDRAISNSILPLIGLGPRGSFEPAAQCLGWLSLRLNPSAPQMLFHDGGTAGSTCALYVCPQKQAAVAVLANRGVAAGFWSQFKLAWADLHGVASEHFASL